VEPRKVVEEEEEEEEEITEDELGRAFSSPGRNEKYTQNCSR
jgi:hypothetical protein